MCVCLRYTSLSSEKMNISQDMLDLQLLMKDGRITETGHTNNDYLTIKYYSGLTEIILYIIANQGDLTS